MGMIDDLAALRTKRTHLASLQWCCSKAEPRAFFSDANRTREADLDQKLITEALGIVEHEHSSDISYCASYVVGEAIKRCVLRHIDKQIASLSALARAEIEAAQQFLKEPTDA